MPAQQKPAPRVGLVRLKRPRTIRRTLPGLTGKMKPLVFSRLIRQFQAEPTPPGWEEAYQDAVADLGE